MISIVIVTITVLLYCSSYSNSYRLNSKLLSEIINSNRNYFTNNYNNYNNYRSSNYQLIKNILIAERDCKLIMESSLENAENILDNNYYSAKHRVNLLDKYSHSYSNSDDTSHSYSYSYSYSNGNSYRDVSSNSYSNSDVSNTMTSNSFRNSNRNSYGNSTKMTDIVSNFNTITKKINIPKLILNRFIAIAKNIRTTVKRIITNIVTNTITNTRDSNTTVKQNKIMNSDMNDKFQFLQQNQLKIIKRIEYGKANILHFEIYRKYWPTQLLLLLPKVLRPKPVAKTGIRTFSSSTRTMDDLIEREFGSDCNYDSSRDSAADENLDNSYGNSVGNSDSNSNGNSDGNNDSDSVDSNNNTNNEDNSESNSYRNNIFNKDRLIRNGSNNIYNSLTSYSNIYSEKPRPNVRGNGKYSVGMFVYMWVHPLFRRNNLGEQLLYKAMTECISKGDEYMLLVHDDNGSGKLQNYYEMRGFHNIDYYLQKGMICKLK